MNRRFLLALAGAALCGLLAILITQKILITKNKMMTDVNYPSIVIAKTKINSETTITAEMLKLSPYFQANLPEGSSREMKDFIGKTAITEIDANLPITMKNVVAAGQSRIQKDIPRDLRAISIRVDEASGVAGFARPGSYVDVIAVMNPGNGSRTISKTIVQNLKIIAYGNQIQTKSDDQLRTVNTVTLEATPAQAESLTLAMREGTLHLMLRNPSDHDLQRTTGVVANNLVDNMPAVPTATPAHISKASIKDRDFAPIPSPQPTKKVEATVPSSTPASNRTEYKVYEGTTEKTILVKK